MIKRYYSILFESSFIYLFIAVTYLKVEEIAIFINKFPIDVAITTFIVSVAYIIFSLFYYFSNQFFFIIDQAIFCLVFLVFNVFLSYEFLVMLISKSSMLSFTFSPFPISNENFITNFKLLTFLLAIISFNKLFFSKPNYKFKPIKLQLKILINNVKSINEIKTINLIEYQEIQKNILSDVQEIKILLKKELTKLTTSIKNYNRTAESTKLTEIMHVLVNLEIYFQKHNHGNDLPNVKEDLGSFFINPKLIELEKKIH